MSLKPQPISPVPEETVRVARAAFPKGNLYLTMRDEIGTQYTVTVILPLCIPLMVNLQLGLGDWR